MQNMLVASLGAFICLLVRLRTEIEKVQRKWQFCSDIDPITIHSLNLLNPSRIIAAKSHGFVGTFFFFGGKITSGELALVYRRLSVRGWLIMAPKLQKQFEETKP